VFEVVFLLAFFLDVSDFSLLKTVIKYERR